MESPEGGVALFDLPLSPRFRMDEPSLVQALAQVRFPIQATWQTLGGVAPLQEALRDAFPIMERQNVAQVAISIGPVPESPPFPLGQSVNWQFQTEDGYALVVEPGSATLSIGSQYTNVDDFSAKFELVLRALAAAKLPRCDRLGVRYLDLVDCPPDDDTWRGFFRPELFGWTGAGVLLPDAQLNSSITQTQIAARGLTEDTELQAIVHHGILPAGVAVAGIPPIKRDVQAFMLDLDLFVPTPQAFDPPALIAQFNSLHDQIDRFFRWALTDAGEARFGLIEVSGS